MSTFLFASVPIQAHTTNPLPFAARLVERGHTVLWYAGQAFHDKIAAVGAQPLPYVKAVDFSGHDIFEFFPQYAGRGGPRVIGEVFAEIFVGHAAARVADLRAIIAGHKVDAILSDALMYGVGMVGELEDIPTATFGDGPVTSWDPDVPPFGPGMLPMAGPIGRLRNRFVRAMALRVLFRDAQRTYERTRADLGLPVDPRSMLEVMMSEQLHLQGSTPSFEYALRQLPPQLHWVGALRPDPVPGWTPPSWWDELGRPGRPVIHVTQGSLRPDLTELIVPAIRALADEPALVVVTTGGANREQVERTYGEALPANVRVEPFIPYDDLLPRADLFVTNGGYTGVTLALAHGVPILQAGTTEEKSEIGARIQWSGVGLRLGTTRPKPSKIIAAVRRLRTEPSFKAAAAVVQREMAEHNASTEGADLLERLATTRAAVLRTDTAAALATLG